MRKGILFVFSGPSGAGKGTVLKEVFKQIEDLEYSTSATTREVRKGEEHGKDYNFITDEEFDKKIRDGEMLEYISKYGNRYGTIKSTIEQTLKKGKDIVLEIETTGAEKVRSTNFKAVYIFLTPSSICKLVERLRVRNTETEDWQNHRIEIGREEIKCAYKYDYIVINDHIETAVKDLLAIIHAERCKVAINQHKIKTIIEN